MTPEKMNRVARMIEKNNIENQSFQEFLGDVRNIEID